MGSVRSTTTRTTSASTTGVGDKPAGTAAGDILIAVLSSSLTAAVTPPAGWDNITTPNGQGVKNSSQPTIVSNGCGLYFYLAVGGEGATFSFTGTSREWIIDIICLRDINIPIRTAAGGISSVCLFDVGCSTTRNGSTLSITDEPGWADMTYDHYFLVGGFGFSEAAQTRTLSAPSAYLTQVAASALVGVSQLSAYAEISLDDTADDPTIGPTQCTISSASGNSRNFFVMVADPISTVGVRRVRDRPGPSLGNGVN